MTLRLTLIGGAFLALLPQPASAQAAPSLPEAIRMGQEGRSKIKAGQLMVARAEAQLAEVSRLAHNLGLVRPDLPIRREQAALALEIARADHQAQEADVRYAVSRTYVSVLYARSARQLAVKAAEYVAEYRAALARLKGPVTGLDPFLSELAGGPTLQAEMRVIDAEKGVAISLAALRQAIGLEAATPLPAPKAALPNLEPAIPSAEEVLRVVLAGNPELRRVALLERIHYAEADAQAKLTLARVADTFAATGDVHSAAIPPEGGDEYRPAPIVPEMPARLVGAKSARVESARLLAAKATEVRRGVEGLLALRVTAVWETVREKRRKLEAVEKRHAGRLEKIEAALAKPPGKGREALLQEGILAIAAAAELETARWEYLVALLDLEKLTLGAFCPGIAESLAMGG